MNQDFAATAERVQRGLEIRPSDGPAVRASGFDVRFDGGAFTLHLYDVRESPEPHGPGPTEKWQSVEIGRFAISPQALVRLKQATATAEALYSAVMGQTLLSEAEMNARFFQYVTKGQQPETAAPKARKR